MKPKKNLVKMNEMNYLKDFACIGGICEDNCCIGWDVDIDQQTFARYQKVSDPQLKALYKEKIKPYPYYFDPAVDYARVKLGKDKRCPFLTSEGLCITQAKLGEDYLSNVCATYPRMTNEVDGVLEGTLTLSCPVAAKLVLLPDQELHWQPTTQLPKRKIINLSIQTDLPEYKHHPVKHFHLLRSASLDLVLDARFPLNTRLFGLGLLYEQLAEDQRKKQINAMPARIKTFMDEWFSSELPSQLKEAGLVNIQNLGAPNLSQSGARLYLTDGILHRLKVFTAIDSKAFVGYTRQYCEAFRVDPKTKKADPKRYPALQSAFQNQIGQAHGTILENYVHNYIYKNLFPFTESENLFEAYAMLAVRVILIETYGAALCAEGKALSPEAFVTFIQVFAKAVEHHKNFSELTIEALRKEDLFNMFFIGQCLELG